MIISTSDCLSAEFRNPRGFLSLKANELSRLGGGGGEGGGGEEALKGEWEGGGGGGGGGGVRKGGEGVRSTQRRIG